MVTTKKCGILNTRKLGRSDAMRCIKKYATLCFTFLAVMLGCCVWGFSSACGRASKQQLVGTYVSPTQSIALEAEVNGNALHIDVKPQEKLQALTDASGKPYAQAGSLTLPADATEVSVDFMRQFSAVASQITTITLGEGVQALGDAYYSEADGRYIGVFDGFTSLQTVDMPAVDKIGSYAFYTCANVTTITTNAEVLTLNNYSISETNVSLHIVDANLVEVTFNGTWGTSGSGSTYTGGITQHMVRILPYEQLEYITCSDAVYLGEQAVIGCSSLKVVDVRSAVAVSWDNLDVLITNPNFLLSSHDFPFIGNPLNIDAVDQVETVEEMIVLLKNMHACLYLQIDAPESDLQYFNLEEKNTYISEDSTAPYMHVLNKNNTQTIFFDIYYTANNYSITNSSGENYLRYFTPTRNFNGYLESDVTTLYIPSSFGDEKINYINGDFFDIKAYLYDDTEVDAYQNINKLIISGGYTTVGSLWETALDDTSIEGPFKNLKTLIFADGIENLLLCVMDNMTQIEEVWLPNTLHATIPGESITALALMINPTFVKFYMNDSPNAEISITADHTTVLSADGLTILFGNNQGFIPSGVKTIAPYAFAFTNNIPENYELPNSVERIADGGYYSVNMTSLTIPDSVTYIADCGFYYIENLTYVRIGSGISYIGRDNFENMNGDCFIEEFYIDKHAPITSLPYGFLENAEHLTVLQLSDNIETIGNNSFTYHNLSRIILPANLVSLGNNCFDTGYVAGDNSTVHKMKYIDLMNMPVNTTSIGTNAFNGCFFDGYILLMDSIENYPSDNAFKTFLEEAQGSLVYGNIKNTQILHQTTPTDIELNYIWYEGFDGVWENTTNPALIRIENTYYHRSLEFSEYTLTEADVTYQTTEDGTGIIITQFNTSAQNKDYVRIPDRFTELPIVEIRVSRPLTVNKGVKLPDTLKIIGTNSFIIAYGSVFEIPAGVEQIHSNFVGQQSRGISSFVVSPDNQHFQAIDGVLATKGGEYVDLVALTADLFVPEGIQRILSTTPATVLTGSVYISSTVQYIVNDTELFTTIANFLETVEVDPENKWYSSGNGNNYIKEKATNTVIFACPNTILDDSVEAVNLTAYVSVVMDYLYIPDSVTRIYGTLSGLVNTFKHIRLSANLTSLDEMSVAGLTNIGILEFPENSKITAIPSTLYPSSLLTSIKCMVLPSTIASISFERKPSMDYVLAANTTVLNLAKANISINGAYGGYVLTTTQTGSYYVVDNETYGSRLTTNGTYLRLELYDGTYAYYAKS